jgi:hypothetical protein
MKISEKRKAGEILERGGIASRIIAIANDIREGTFKNAVEKAGQIHELIEAASFDDYWNEKATKGRMFEKGVLTDLNNGDIHRDKVAHNVNPYDA